MRKKRQKSKKKKRPRTSGSRRGRRVMIDKKNQNFKGKE